MEKPAIIKEIEKITSTELTLVASPEEAMVYKNNTWYYSVDTDENLTGLNLHSQGIDGRSGWFSKRPAQITGAEPDRKQTHPVRIHDFDEGIAAGGFEPEWRLGNGRVFGGIAKFGVAGFE